MTTLRSFYGTSLRPFVASGAVALWLAFSANPLVAQAGAGAPGSQNMRPFQYLFVAYALAWLLVFGWVLSVGRRLAKLDKRLGSSGEAQ